jgi:capsular exopolysaccharide synthesis family protein
MSRKEHDMSGVHRALERADREGLLTWTRGEGDPADRTTLAVPDLPRATPPEDLASEAGPVVAEPSPRVAQGSISPLFVAATNPGCFGAQQYRFLRTRLEGRDNSTDPQVWLVTSPCSGDGKTTTSANLALTMAREFQQKVVLVEADLHRPTLAASFGVPEDPGLVDVLMGSSTLEDALKEVPDQQLCLLPAGLAAPSTELLASTMMQRAMTRLRARFTRIVIDTLPAVAADTHVLMRLADSVLVVVRVGMTPRSALARTLGTIDRQQLRGIVLNSVDTTPDQYGYVSYSPQGAES